MSAEQDVLDIVVTDWRPSRVESREAIRVAIMRAASESGGLVHAADVRKHLPSWVAKAQIGAVTCQLVRSGALVPVGRLRANGDAASRNRTKRSDVRRLTRAIDPKELA